MSERYLISAKQSHAGPRNEDARIRRLEARLDDLVKRVAMLEAKRGPGRPPKDQAA